MTEMGKDNVSLGNEHCLMGPRHLALPVLPLPLPLLLLPLPPAPLRRALLIEAALSALLCWTFSGGLCIYRVTDHMMLIRVISLGRNYLLTVICVLHSRGRLNCTIFRLPVRTL